MVFLGMNLIELDNCFVQPRAILTISADDFFDESTYQLGGIDKDDPSNYDWGWVFVINVILLHRQKRTLRFANKADRDARFAEIVAQLKNA